MDHAAQLRIGAPFCAVHAGTATLCIAMCRSLPSTLPQPTWWWQLGQIDLPDRVTQRPDRAILALPHHQQFFHQRQHFDALALGTGGVDVACGQQVAALGVQGIHAHCRGDPGLAQHFVHRRQRGRDLGNHRTRTLKDGVIGNRRASSTKTVARRAQLPEQRGMDLPVGRRQQPAPRRRCPRVGRPQVCTLLPYPVWVRMRQPVRPVLGRQSEQADLVAVFALPRSAPPLRVRASAQPAACHGPAPPSPTPTGAPDGQRRPAGVIPARAGTGRWHAPGIH